MNSSNVVGFDLFPSGARYTTHCGRQFTGDLNFTGTSVFSNNVTTAISCGAHLIYVEKRAKFNGYKLSGSGSVATDTNRMRLAVYTVNETTGFVDVQNAVSDSGWQTWNSALVSSTFGGSDVLYEFDMSGEVWLNPGYYWVASMMQSNFTGGNMRANFCRSTVKGLRHIQYTNAAELTANASYASQNFPTGWSNGANFALDTADGKHCSMAISLIPVGS